MSVLKVIGALVVSVFLGSVGAAVVTALAGVWMPEASLIAIPLVFIALMVMS